MSDIRNGKVYAMLFVFFIVCLVVGGFILTQHFVGESKKDLGDEVEEKLSDSQESFKIDNDKDYIYFLNEDKKDEDIIYQDVKINILNANALNIENKLNEEMALLRESYKKIDEVELSEEEREKIIYKEKGIYEAKYSKYTRYFYQDYVSLLQDDYSFDCFNGEKYLRSSAYVFNIKTGKLYTNKELLELYNISFDEIKQKISEKLKLKQSTVVVDEEMVELINIVDTLKGLDNEDNYAFYIDKAGFLTISYLVKTLEKDYNDVININ